MSEKHIGNKNAKKGERESMVMRLPVSVVDGLAQCLIAEGWPEEPNKRDILEHALTVLKAHIEQKTGEYIPRTFFHEDGEALKYLTPEE